MEINPFLGTIIGNTIIAIAIIIVIKIVGLFKKHISEYIDYLTSLTVGLLLAIVFLGFFPEMLHDGSEMISTISTYILVGLLSFYILELVFHWHHCKDLDHKGHKCGHEHKEEHKKNHLMFSGTLIHNGFHGVVLFSSFSINFHLGILATIAILLHAIPQNIANYIMNHNSPRYSYIAAAGGIVGALLTFPFYDLLIHNEIIVLSFISGALLYTALTDILPEVKEKASIPNKLIYFVFIVIGILLFIGFQEITGLDEHNHEIHEHDEDRHEHEEN